MNWELPDVQAGFRKGRGTRDQIANIRWIIEKAREFQKNICFIDYAKTFDCVDHNKLWKILQGMEITLPASWETCMQVKKKQLEMDMKQQLGSKLGKEDIKAIYCHPAYLTYMQSTSCEMLGWMNEAQAGIKIARRNINNLRYADVTTIMAESEEELKSLLMKVKVESEKAGLKLNIQKTNFMAAVTICSDSGAPKIKSITFSTVSPSFCYEVMGPDDMT